MKLNITKGTTFSDNQINQMIERINAENGDTQAVWGGPSDLQIAQAKLMLMEEGVKPLFFDAEDFTDSAVFNA